MLVQQAFDEIGIALGDQFADAVMAGGAAEPEPAAAETDELEARRANLRNGVAPVALRPDVVAETQVLPLLASSPLELPKRLGRLNEIQLDKVQDADD